MYLSEEPYQAKQPDINGNERLVWIFPLKLLIEKQPVAIALDSYQKLKEKRQKIIRKMSSQEILKRAQESAGIPLKRMLKTTAYERNDYVVQCVKERANGKCELCKQEAPFKNIKGEPYLESHHIVWLSKGGEDTISNTVALCPNCHRRMHILNIKKDIKKLKHACFIHNLQ